MKWLKYSLATTTAAVDLVSELLNEIGIDGIEIEDSLPLSEADKKQMFVDILPEAGPDNGRAVIYFYLEEAADKEKVLAALEEGLTELSGFVDLGERSLKESVTEDEDWVNNWKAFFHPFRIEDEVQYSCRTSEAISGLVGRKGSVLIKPTWEEVPSVRDEEVMIEIDPGISFGTGSHETTKLCILAIRNYLREGDEMLDVGCGSGILSIAAIKSGAEHVFAVDIDPVAVNSAKENIETNHIDEAQIQTASGDLINDASLRALAGFDKYDMVVANILADILIPLTPAVVPAMKKGAYYITSGIINTRKEDVREAMEKAGLKIIEIGELKDWVCIVGKKED